MEQQTKEYCKCCGKEDMEKAGVDEKLYKVI